MIYPVYKNLALRIRTEIPEIKFIGWYRGQTRSQTKEHPLPCPAVLIEFDDIPWKTQGEGYQEGDAVIRFHFVAPQLGTPDNPDLDDSHRALNYESAIMSLTSKIHKALQGYEVIEDVGTGDDLQEDFRFSGKMTRTQSGVDHLSYQYHVVVQSYKCWIRDPDITHNLTDHTVLTLTTDLDLVQHIDSDGSIVELAPGVAMNCTPQNFEAALSGADLSDEAYESALLSNLTVDAFIEAHKTCPTAAEILASADLSIEANETALLANDGIDAFIEEHKTCPTVINTANPIKTGQITSSVAYDDGYFQYGRLNSDGTLDYLNPFGNNYRFTDLVGGQADSSDLLILDWSQWSTVHNCVLMIHNSQVSATGLLAISGAAAISVGGYSTNWRLPNRRELFNLQTMASGISPFIDPVFNISIPNSNSSLWSNTWIPDAIGVELWCIAGSGIITLRAATSNGSYVAVRTTLISEIAALS
jgi:hypothetical protein